MENTCSNCKTIITPVWQRFFLFKKKEDSALEV